MAVDADLEPQLRPGGVEASAAAVDSEALLVLVVGGAEKKARELPWEWNSATTPGGRQVGEGTPPSRPAGGPPAGRRPRPSARRRAGRSGSSPRLPSALAGRGHKAQTAAMLKKAEIRVKTAHGSIGGLGPILQGR